MGLLGGRFGTVDKAAFLIGKKQKDDGTWDFEEPVEVLINPNKLRVMSTTQVKKEEGVANDSTSSSQNVDGKITPKGITEESVEMTLLFNVVEAYNAKAEGAQFKALASAAKSLLGSAFNGNLADTAEDTLSELINKTDFTSLSILNPEICCYTPLLVAAHKQVPVVFYWGNLTYPGLITKFQTTFNYFSSQGAPLGAEVSLSMVSGVDDAAEKLSVSTQKLLGLVKLGGKLIRELPGK